MIFLNINLVDYLDMIQNDYNLSITLNNQMFSKL